MHTWLRKVHRVVDVVRLCHVGHPERVIVFERNLLLVGLEDGQLVHVVVHHEPLKASNQVQMHVDCVLEVHYPLLELTLELLSLLVAEPLRVIPESVEHGAEVFVLLLSPDVQVTQRFDVVLLEDVIRLVALIATLQVSAAEDHALLSPEVAAHNLVGERITAEATTAHDGEDEDDLRRSIVKTNAHEFGQAQEFWPPMHLFVVILWSQHSLVREHKADHQQVEEDAPLHQRYRVQRDLLIEVEAAAIASEHQVFVDNVAKHSVDRSK